MACERCREIGQSRTIDLPAHLSEAIVMVHDGIDRGVLVEIRSETDPLERYNAPFSEISPKGPWPDYVACSFACTGCNARFQLSVETYHGRGGAWGPQPLDASR